MRTIVSFQLYSSTIILLGRYHTKLPADIHGGEISKDICEADFFND